MCNCIVADCWWCNGCDLCVGFSTNLCCVSFWCCRPDDFPWQGDQCCIYFRCTGYGGNLGCFGGVCCSPWWLRSWARGKGAI